MFIDVEEVLKIFSEEFRKVYSSRRIVSSFDVRQAIIITNGKISGKINDMFNRMSIEKQQQLEAEKLMRFEMAQKMLETLQLNPRKRKLANDDDTTNKQQRL